VGEKLIADQVEKIPNEKARAVVKDRLEKIEQGQRDFRF